MIGLDTNVLVRYIVQDEPQQAAAATRLIDGLTSETPAFISTVALVETVWVLAVAYKTPRSSLATVIEGLLRARELVIENADIHYLALGAFQTGALDYADAVIYQVGKQAGCDHTVTFDKRAAASHMTRLEA